jgi:Lrp/AsnC family transcriptional regulator for asnA, asnC and gidA
MSKNFEIDNTDLRILEILMQDAKRPYTEVAKKRQCFARNCSCTNE